MSTDKSFKLEWLLGVANLVPCDETPPNIFDGTYRPLEDQIADFKKTYENRFPRLVKWLSENKTADKFIEMYDFAKSVRAILCLIADRADDYRNHLQNEGLEFWYRDPLRTQIVMRINYEFDESPNDGKIRFEGDWITNTLSGLELKRFRRCGLESCRKIFYQARSDQKACEVKHSKAMAQKAYIAKPGNREKVNADRRSNRQTVSKRNARKTKRSN